MVDSHVCNNELSYNKGIKITSFGVQICNKTNKMCLYKNEQNKSAVIIISKHIHLKVINESHLSLSHRGKFIIHYYFIDQVSHLKLL